MSNCMGAPAHEWLERYIDGSLAEDDAQAFELHYFECPVCLGELHAVQAAQEQLRRHPVAVAPKARVLSWPTLVSAGALAAALVVGFVTFRAMRQVPAPAGSTTASSPAQPSSPVGQPVDQIAHLADLNLPPFRASTLRGESSDTPFTRGMKLYSGGNCAGAVTALSQVDAASSDALPARFYAGVCRMHEGNLAAAETALRHVTAAGDSPQEEAAWYYLAQISLARSDGAAARRDLQKVVALHGDFERAAKKQLGQIPR